MTTYTPQSIDYLINNISTKLGVNEIKEGSFLYSLVKTIKEEKDLSINSIYNTLNNFHIETCDENMLNIFGNDLGIKKISTPLLNIESSDNIAFLTTFDNSNFPSFLVNSKVLAKGESITWNSSTITATEDWIIPNNTNKLYVSCSISSTDNISIDETSIIKINFNAEYLQYLLFKVSKGITFLNLKETTQSYRNRILLEISNKETDIVLYLKKIFENIPGIKLIKFDNNIYYFATNNMIDNGSNENSKEYGRILDSELIKHSTYPNKFYIKEMDKAIIYCYYSIVGERNNTQETIKQEVYKIIYNLVNIKNIVTKNYIENLIKIAINESIIINDMYAIDVVTGSKIYNFTSFNDLYFYINQSNIVEE